MQRVVILFVGILSVVRATPFDLDSINRPTPFGYKVKSGNDASSEDDYFGLLKDHSNIIDKSGKGRSRQGLRDSFGDLEYCSDPDSETTVIPAEGCAYYEHGDVFFINVLSTVDRKDVYKALGDAGIPECVLTDGFNDLPEGGCFNINQGSENVYLLGVYNDETVQKIEDLSDAFGRDIDICLNIVDEVLDQGCLMYGSNSLHLLNVLNEDNIAVLQRLLSNLKIEKCDLESDKARVEPCYWVNEEFESIHFIHLSLSDDVDDNNYGKGTSGILDTKFSTHVSPSVKTTLGLSGIDILQKLIFKDSVDQPTPFRYKVEFSNDAYSEDYYIGILKDHSNIIDESDEVRSLQGLRDLFGDLKFCGDLESETTVIPEEGCTYYEYGDVYFINVLSSVDIEDVHKAIGDARIPECVSIDGVYYLPNGGCFKIEHFYQNVNLLGVYNDETVQKIEDLSNAFGRDIDICLDVVDLVLDQGCLMYGGNSLHLLNVLNEDNIAVLERLLSNLKIEECDLESDKASVEPCYWVNKKFESIHLIHLSLSDDVDDNNYGKGTTGIQDTKVLSYVLPSLKTTTGIDILQLKGLKLKFKGLLNRVSLATKTSKTPLLKKKQSRKPIQEAQKKRERQTHGRLDNNGGKVNPNTKWMKYLQTTF